MIASLITATGCTQTEKEKRKATHDKLIAEMDSTNKAWEIQDKAKMDSLMLSIDSEKKEIDRHAEFMDYKLKIIKEGVKQGKTFKQAEAYADSVCGGGSRESEDARMRADMEKYNRDSNSTKK